jgi:predicted permease
MRILLSLVSRLVPRRERPRWREEWLAELQHGRRRMILGALPDAWAMRRVAGVPAEAGRYRRRPFHALEQDLRYACRGLIARPGFTLSVILSLGIGIATTSAAFGFLHDVTFRSAIPGVTVQDALARVTVNRGCGWPGCWISSTNPDEIQVLAGSFRSFDGLAASASAPVAMLAHGEATAIRAGVVSSNYFDVLGIRPSLGRGFTPDEGALAQASVAVIGHTLWQRAFGADRNVLGSFIQVNGRPVQIVGVAPPSFGETPKGNMMPGGEYGIELWLPLPLAHEVLTPETLPGGRPLPTTEYEFTYVARLKHGVSIEDAQADATVATSRIKAFRGITGADNWVQVGSIRRNTTAEAARLLRNLMIAPMLVLAIACLNAANLLLARGSERARDIAVRLALGASRWRVVRQLLCESLLLALASGVVALPVISLLIALASEATNLPVTVNRPTLIFAGLASVLASIGFGLTPALQAVRTRIPLGSSRSCDHGPGRMRGRRFMVGLQVALSLGVLATGGQVIGATQKLLEHTGANDPASLVVASFDLAPLKLPEQAGEAFYDQLLARATQLPGVEGALLARRSAFWGWGLSVARSSIIAWGPADGPREGRLYRGGYVAGDMVRTMGLPLVSGRGFVAADPTPAPSAAIVSRAFADAKFSGAAVGRTIRVAARSQGYSKSVEVRIVGVVDAAEDRAYSRRPLPTVYVASPLEYEPALSLYVRAPGGLATVAQPLRALVREIDPRVPVAEIMTVASLTERRNFEERVMANGLTLIGAIALGLATAGLYALVTFMVTLRQRELGIRMALGAEPAGILRLVLSQSLRLAAFGGAFGALLAVALGAVAHASIVGTPRVHAGFLLVSASALAAAMLLASAIPARRAARVDPVTVLRQE